ncbi:MAG: bifunctional 4-hydroxy-2-oxoglutarate aldolase/2-dehydro-3-deoxy-phosphogluconate aldolase [Leptolyngbya sp. SIO1E4]|nr:bifunctional 4-hydroxy-2-oxoglutarate aldolase/2-dehydro-3-deoxy-phosphogluconate aldolase [Leptolyngbya sp. SIO1E4]
MYQDSWLATLRRHRAIAVIRASHLTTGLAMAQAVMLGGFRLIEVTWNSDRPAELIHRLRHSLPQDCQVGAGTLLSPQALKEAITAGAQFCFTPHTDTALIHLAQTQTIPIIPGALTPTEIALAWQSGASSVKVFPSQSLGGAAYIRHLQGPLSHIPLIPTGGVTVENGQAFLAAGAIAVGMSSSLFPKPLMLNQDWTAIQQRSQTFLKTLKPENCDRNYSTASQ